MRKITQTSQLPQDIQKEIAQKKARNVLRDKYQSKKKSQLAQADVIEYMKVKMAEELGLAV